MPALINPFLRIPMSVEYITSYSQAAASFDSDVDIGDAAASKEIFIVASVTYPSGRTFDSATVAGVAATKFSSGFSSADDLNTGCFVALPTQSGVQTITLNFSDTLGSGVVNVYKVLNRPGIGTNHVDAQGHSPGGDTGNSITLDQVTIPAGGLWLATGIKNLQNTTSWNNGTPDEDQHNTLLVNSGWCASRIAAAEDTPSDVFSWTGNCLRSGAAWAFS